MTYKFKHPILQLNWLPQYMLKSVPFYPDIFLIDNLIPPGGTGCYMRPSDEETFEGHPCKNGIIVISKLTKDVRSTLAHEFRHHWQHFNTTKVDSNISAYILASLFDPVRAYIEYYKQPHEFDALLFECRVAPNEHNTKVLQIVLENWN